MAPPPQPLKACHTVWLRHHCNKGAGGAAEGVISAFVLLVNTFGKKDTLANI